MGTRTKAARRPGPRLQAEAGDNKFHGIDDRQPSDRPAEDRADEPRLRRLLSLSLFKVIRTNPAQDIHDPSRATSEQPLSATPQHQCHQSRSHRELPARPSLGSSQVRQLCRLGRRGKLEWRRSLDPSLYPSWWATRLSPSRDVRWGAKRIRK